MSHSAELLQTQLGVTVQGREQSLPGKFGQISQTDKPVSEAYEPVGQHEGAESAKEGQ
jgi:hypothetical protein